MADTEPERRPTIWVDVEDFFDYFRANPYPSGIQRLAFEIKRALVDAEGEQRVRFVRRSADGQPLVVAWFELVPFMRRERPPRGPGPAPGSDRSGRLRMQRFINALPDDLRGPLFRAGLLQVQAGRKWRETARVLRRRRTAPELAVTPAPALGGSSPDLRPGDRYLVLGAPWAVPGFPAYLSSLKQRFGISAHLLLYDLVPVRHPEWCTKPAVALFEDWLDASLPLFDGLMAISRHTAGDVDAYARERGLTLAGPVRPIPIGTGFGAEPGRPADAARGLPQPGSYVLFVSTLEVRKNHALLFRVWRKLEDEVRAGVREAASVPTLVFAGRVGWLVSDLMQQLENTSWLGGRIRLIADPSDDELRQLYEGCLFTLFPSWFEGWGLPVTESLAAGKPCLASSATALPEAGGALCLYFGPGDAGGAHRAVAALLDQPGAVAAWQAQVQREFRPVPWSETARAVLAAAGA